MSIITFKPIYKTRVWGGNRFSSSLKRNLDTSEPIGESWDIVDRQEDQSVITSDPWQGLTFHELLASHGEQILGPHWKNHKRFPLIIKWLDCRERLSLQVHPPENIAKKFHAESKSEHWFIAESNPDACIYVGLKEGTTKESFKEAINSQNVEEYLKIIPTTQQGSIFIPSGCLHGIGAGNLILEIQQNSDTTYRVYDWNRLGLDGKPRDLHIQESLASIDFSGNSPQFNKNLIHDSTLIECDYFRIKFLKINENLSHLETFEGPKILSILSGKLHLTDNKQVKKINLKKGDNILLTYSNSFKLIVKSECGILITDKFI